MEPSRLSDATTASSLRFAFYERLQSNRGALSKQQQLRIIKYSMAVLSLTVSAVFVVLNLKFHYPKNRITAYWLMWFLALLSSGLLTMAIAGDIARIKFRWLQVQPSPNRMEAFSDFEL
ncbi:hypothetical protein O6H91_16G041500 [Diphasiastrum complanatum]|uniref:Uncharacterized protein n=1 Tax=Diphasiastrum complanatum TaxID=34168 RepID=A0ACC2BBK0_DIPCM|nr:hypothetical protein O6H91_16G041500 [Diphasiastrum complanatum]